MDLRKAKTIQRIKDGFKKLIQEKKYAGITIQDILDESDTGRTTFYMHYKSKDEVLKSIVDDIFFKVNQVDILKDKDSIGDQSFLFLLNHTLELFLEDYALLKAILGSESHNILLEYIEKHFTKMIEDYMIPYYTCDDIPEEILLNHLSTSLTEIILWWICKDDCSKAPLQISYYYFSLVMPALTTKGFTYTISDNIKKIS